MIVLPLAEEAVLVTYKRNGDINKSMVCMYSHGSVQHFEHYDLL